MAVASPCPFHQGNCKNAFCQGILPPNEITIVRPPNGNPEAAPDEYWLLKCTLYDFAQDTGMIRSAQSCAPLTSHPLLKIRASIQVLPVTLWILCQQYPQHCCPLVCMLMVLSISWRIP
jgi:hypothetical protein